MEFVFVVVLVFYGLYLLGDMLKKHEQEAVEELRQELKRNEAKSWDGLMKDMRE